MDSQFARPKLGSPPLNLLLFPIKVPAGFPSPAQDYLAKRIDLNDLLVKHPSSTFYVQASGDSMYPDICDGDILVVDRNAEITNGCTVLACIDNEFCVKQYFKRPDGSIELLSVNPDYPPVNLPDECTFEIWAKVTAAIKIEQFR